MEASSTRQSPERTTSGGISIRKKSGPDSHSCEPGPPHFDRNGEAGGRSNAVRDASASCRGVRGPCGRPTEGRIAARSRDPPSRQENRTRRAHPCRRESTPSIFSAEMVAIRLHLEGGARREIGRGVNPIDLGQRPEVRLAGERRRDPMPVVKIRCILASVNLQPRLFREIFTESPAAFRDDQGSESPPARPHLQGGRPREEGRISRGL